MPTVNYQVAADVLKKLRAIDSCTVSNAIEQLEIRLRNEGFVRGCVRSMTPSLPPMVGHAATGRIRTAEVPTTKHRYYHRIDWWSYLLTIPEPRVIVLQDVDERPGLGAFFDEIHAHIALPLGCVGYVTDGAARDVPGIERTGFHLFASEMSVSHAYAHVLDFGEPVEIGGLIVKPGDLLHGDRHGIVSVPISAAPEIPRIASELRRGEREIIQLCQSPGFSLKDLREYLERNEPTLE